MKTHYTVLDGEVIVQKQEDIRDESVSVPPASTVVLLHNTATFAYRHDGEEASRRGSTATSVRWIGTQGYDCDGSSKTYVRVRSLDA